MIGPDPNKRHEDGVRENLERATLIRPLFDGLEVLEGPSYPGDRLDAVYKLRNPRTHNHFQIIDHRHIPRGQLLVADVQQQLSGHLQQAG